MELQQEARQWAKDLTPETKTQLEAVLSVILPVSEVRCSNPFDVAIIAMSDFDFASIGIEHRVAVSLLNAVKWKVVHEYMDVDEDKLHISSEAIVRLNKLHELLRSEAPTRTDLQRGVVVLNGKPIKISNGRETNALLLLKTLSEEPARDWWNDEIYEKWEGEHWHEAMKRSPKRVYTAARELNDKFAREGVPNFIQCDTKKFRINPRYLGTF